MYTLPSESMNNRHDSELDLEVNGALRLASASLKLTPILAYLMAEQSLAPSPTIHTNSLLSYNYLTTYAFYYGIILPNILHFFTI